MVYQAPRLHYFAREMPQVQKMIESARII
jgi:hypothetical protein